MALPRTAPARILIEAVTPALDGGRWPVKRTLGTPIEIAATILRDGHDQLRAVALLEDPTGGRTEVPLGPTFDDRFVGVAPLGSLGVHRFRVVAWVDRFASWREEVSRKLAAGQRNLEGEAAEGRVILDGSLGRLRGQAREGATLALAALDSGELRAALDEDLAQAIAAAGGAREDVTRSGWFPVDVDPVRAEFGAWYELFPRSFGGLEGVRAALPTLAGLGFDVVYLPPIHPIGRTNRKGPNNSPSAGPDDPGSPWAIGGAEGGHTAIHPELGTLEDFARLVERAAELGLDIALDLALQCSPDHPWLVEHPEWFQRRPDGSIKFAENPPKRYEDIHNLDFGCADWRGLWSAIAEVVVTWVERGVRVFRVDNPHTKPLGLWEWLIREVRSEHPDVIFLAEAFTRPAPMRALAKAGFSQSYTYFTWKNTRAELSEFVDLMAAWSDCVRPNLFANTPDILHEYLQRGGPPAFQTRLVLAATLAPSYGIYSGFERFEGTPVRPGSEEYLDSEKYQIRTRDLAGPLLPLVSRLNALRRAHPPLQRLGGTTLLETRSPDLFAFARGGGAGAIIVCVNLNPAAAATGVCHVPEHLAPAPRFAVRDLLTDRRYEWGVGDNYVRLDPSALQAHVFVVEL